ncbi:hypothetical protein ACFZBU_46655 [Embleya sp. NPDC008237]|uniref:hypothetical protein n=1 Tax=Embleya sp. NPDC008237 TaxID=3363978 RepID=UPI0036E733FB
MRPARGRFTAALVPLLLATGACSDSDNARDAKDGSNGPVTEASSTGIPGVASDTPKGKELTAEQLRAAWVVERDLPRRWTPTGEVTRPALNPKAAKPQCQPIADLEDLSGAAAPKAVTHLGLESEETPGTVHSVSIALLSGNDATGALDAARKALPSCGDFAETTDNPAPQESSTAEYALTGGAGHDLGDDSLSLEFGTDDGQYSIVVTVVRVGPVLVRGMSLGMFGPPPVAIPEAVMKAQVDKIAAITSPAR